MKSEIFFLLLVFGAFPCGQIEAFEVCGALSKPWEYRFEDLRESLSKAGDQIVKEIPDLLVVRSHLDREMRVAYLFYSGNLCSVDSYMESAEAKRVWSATVRELRVNGSPQLVVSLTMKASDGYSFLWQNGGKTKLVQFYSIHHSSEKVIKPVTFVVHESVVNVALCPSFKVIDDFLPDWTINLAVLED